MAGAGVVTGDALRDVLTDGRLLWFLNRGSGLVLLVLLTLGTASGVLSTARTASRRWPRFVTQRTHRNVALVALVLLVVHPATAAIDDFVDIRWFDAFLPGGSAYRPLWTGLGALALDVVVVVVATSLLRHRLRLRTWRAVHVTAYAAWVLAVAHGLGMGTDVREPWFLSITLASVGAVVVAAVLRTSTLAHEHRLQRAAPRPATRV